MFIFEVVLRAKYRPIIALAIVIWAAPMLVAEDQVRPWLDIQIEDFQLDMHPLDLEPSGQIVKAASDYPAHDGWPNLLSWSTYCFLGTVDRVRYDCGLRPGAGAESVAVVQFSVDEMYWGPLARSAVLEIDVTRPECAVTCSWPTFAEFTVGCRYLIVGPRGARPNRPNFHQVYRLESDQLVDESGETWIWSEVVSAIGSESRLRPGSEDRITR